MVKIRSELRGDESAPEIWANLGDIVDWLDTLPEKTGYRIAGTVAVEIRQMLMDSVSNAEFVPSEGD